jgi:hypothetical protein
MTVAGLARAREEGTKLGCKPLEHTDAAKVATIRTMRNKGTGIRRIVRELGVSVRTCEPQATHCGIYAASHLRPSAFPAVN